MGGRREGGKPGWLQAWDRAPDSHSQAEVPRVAGAGSSGLLAEPIGGFPGRWELHAGCGLALFLNVFYAFPQTSHFASRGGCHSLPPEGVATVTVDLYWHLLYAWLFHT